MRNEAEGHRNMQILALILSNLFFELPENPGRNTVRFLECGNFCAAFDEEGSRAVDWVHKTSNSSVFKSPTLTSS
jgi:hypothetical protein